MSVLKSCGRFPWTEPTLGEEIINLTKKGVDVPTVERMYRKYIDLSANKEATQACEEYCKADVEALTQTFNAIFGSNPFLPDDISTGDRIEIPLGNLGTFTATVQKITNDKVLFIFDDYVAKRPMNENGSNDGRYDKSDLKKWIDTELYEMFPEAFRKRMRSLTIPTLGDIYGWDSEWDRTHLEHDYHAQLPLMKQRRNRVSYYNNECTCGWLRNATKKDVSSTLFASVDINGDKDCGCASFYLGVRPEFWLIR